MENIQGKEVRQLLPRRLRQIEFKREITLGKTEPANKSGCRRGQRGKTQGKVGTERGSATTRSGSGATKKSLKAESRRIGNRKGTTGLLPAYDRTRGFAYV